MTDTEIKKLAKAIGEQILLNVDRPDLDEIEGLLRSIDKKLETLIAIQQ